MEANVKPLPVSAEKTAVCKPGQTFIVGKIQSVEKFSLKSKETRFRTRVLAKAHDDYGYPQPFDVVSDSPIGSVGELFEGVCSSRTYKKDYNTRPDEHGEFKKISQITAEWFLV